MVHIMGVNRAVMAQVVSISIWKKREISRQRPVIKRDVEETPYEVCFYAIKVFL